MSDGDSLNGDPRRELLRKWPYQIWILSEYGKPIYSNCGSEDELCDLFAIVQTMVMRYKHWDNELKCIQAGDVCIRVALCSPLILCIIARHPFNLGSQLDIVFNQVVSMITQSFLNQIYEKRANFDSRRWFDDLDKRVTACVSGFNEDPVVFSSGFRILPMNDADREHTVNIMATVINNKLRTVEFAFLVNHRQLIGIVRRRSLDLTPSDFNVVVNLIETQKSLRDIETNVPICLPNHDPNTFLHAYISFLWNGEGPCLIIICRNLYEFPEMSDVKLEIETKISEYKRCNELKEVLTKPDIFLIKQVASADLWHFMYKNVSLSQVCSSSPIKPCIKIEELGYIYHNYFKLVDMCRRVHNKIKFFFCSLETFSFLAWITDSFELYCILSPFVTKQMAWDVAQNMLKKLRKYEKRIFFTAQAGLLNE